MVVYTLLLNRTNYKAYKTELIRPCNITTENSYLHVIFQSDCLKSQNRNPVFSLQGRKTYPHSLCFGPWVVNVMFVFAM